MSPTQRSIVILLCLIGSLGPAFADSRGRELQLTEVLRSTQKKHPLIADVIAQARTADGKVLGGLGIFDPLLKADGDVTPYGDFEIGKAKVSLTQQTGLWGLKLMGGWKIGRGDFPIYKKNSATSEAGQAQLGLELPLLRGGPIDSGRAKLWAARYEREAAEFRIQLARLELGRQAAFVYWEWVAAGRRLAVATNLLKIAKTRMQQISGRVKQGDLPPIEEIDNQRAILKREGAATSARRAFEKAALALSLYFRDDDLQPIVVPAARLPAGLPVPTAIPVGDALAEDIRYALGNRPELKELVAQRQATSVTRDLADNARLPTLNVSAAGGYDLGNEPFETQRTELLLGLTFRFPTLMRAARGSLQAADGKLGSIDAKTRLVADKILTQTRDAYSALKAAYEALSFAREELTVARQVEEAERERFRLGAATLLTVNLRETAAAEAEVRAVNAAATLQEALADYQAITARGLQL